jgi:hypothetical protein
LSSQAECAENEWKMAPKWLFLHLKEAKRGKKEGKTN